MDLAGAGASLVTLLQKRWVERHGDLQGFTFRVFTTSDFEDDVTDHVSLFLYRIDIDEARRHHVVPPAQPGDPSRSALALELRFLLTVWAGTAEREHQVLGECMEILDRHAILTGDLLDDTYAWEEGDALQVHLESLSNEDLLRLWDSLAPSYRLSIPYLVRTVKLTPAERSTAPLVQQRVNVWTPGVPPPEVVS